MALWEWAQVGKQRRLQTLYLACNCQALQFWLQVLKLRAGVGVEAEGVVVEEAEEEVEVEVEEAEEVEVVEEEGVEV